MKRTINNQLYETKNGTGEQPCAHRCKIIKYEIETGKLGKTKEKMISTQDNICRLKTNGNKTCSWPKENEESCHIPTHH